MKCLSMMSVLLLTSTPLLAAETVTYGGAVSCEEPGFLNLSLARNEGSADLTAWYFDPIQGRYSGVSGTTDWRNGARLDLGNLIFALSDMDSKLSATVVNYDGKPAKGCSSFDLEELATPLERVESYLAQIEAASFTPEDARKIAQAAVVLPPVEMLPDLDRQIFGERRKEAETAYWQGFAEARQKFIAEAPVDDAYAETAHAFLDFDLGPNGTVFRESRPFDRLRNDFELVAARLADAGRDPRQAQASTELACERIHEIFKHDPYGNRDRHLIIATRLPFAFWDRDIAQRNIDGLRACKADTSATWIVDNFPAILKEGERREAIQAEIARLAALPPTLENLLSTDGLTPSREFANKWKIDLQSIEQTAGTTLSEARDKAFAAVEPEVAAAAMERLSTGQAYDASSACHAVLGGSGNMRNRLLDPCVAATQTGIASKRQEQAIARLDNMVAIAGNPQAIDLAKAREADWFILPEELGRDQLGDTRLAEIEAVLKPARDKVAEAMLADLEQEIAGSPDKEINSSCSLAPGLEVAYAAVIEQCRTLVQGHNEGIRTTWCDKRLEEIGATAIQQDIFELYNLFGGTERIVIRDLACVERAPMKFEKSGWFGGSTMKLTLSGSGDPLTAVINRTEEEQQGVWRVSEVEGYAPREGEPASICLISRSSCTRTE